MVWCNNWQLACSLDQGAPASRDLQNPSPHHWIPPARTRLKTRPYSWLHYTVLAVQWNCTLSIQCIRCLCKHCVQFSLPNRAAHRAGAHYDNHLESRLYELEQNSRLITALKSTTFACCAQVWHEVILLYLVSRIFKPAGHLRLPHGMDGVFNPTATPATVLTIPIW